MEILIGDEKVRKACSVFIVIFLITWTGLAFPAEEKKEKSLTVGIYTKHYSGDHTEGTNNHLIAFEYDHLALAWFKNSYGNETAFVGYGWHSEKIEHKNFWIRGNVYAGALLGYGDKHPIHFGMVSPGVYPTGSLGYDIYSVEVSVMPTFWWIGLKVEF